MKQDELPYKRIVKLAETLTQSEIQRKLKIPKSTFYKYCDKFEIKCIKPGLRTEWYVLENYKTKSPKAIAAELKMHEYYIRNVYKRLGIKPMGYTRYIKQAVLGAKLRRTMVTTRIPEPVVEIVVPKKIPKKNMRIHDNILNIISVRQAFSAMNRTNLNILDTL